MANLSFTQKIFGVGMSRTGTSSLSDALNLLGIKTTHYPADVTTHHELANWTGHLSVLDHFQGITDISVAPFYRELDASYPGSRFVLTTRALDSWLDSMERHGEAFNRHRSILSRQYVRFTDFITERLYGTSTPDKMTLTACFKRHDSDVRNYFINRSRSLLTMDISRGDGWDKLADFLELERPVGEFPRTNRANDDVGFLSRLAAVHGDIDSIIPGDATAFVLIDHGLLYDLLDFGDRTAVPFVERHGRFWGMPVDAAAAIAEIQRHRTGGVRFVVVYSSASWVLTAAWMTQFQEYLRREFAECLRNERVVIFESQPMRISGSTRY